MLLSKVGLGQSITSSKLSVCDFENFTLTISHSQRIYFFIDNSIDNGATWALGNIFYSTSSSSPFISNQIISINASTKYRIRYNTINSQTGLTTVDPNLLITWNPLPNATVAVPSTICNGASVSIGATAVTGNTYIWSSNVGTYSSTNSNPSVSPSSTQTYTLTETITATGCSNSNDVTITVNPRPTATLTLSPSPIGKNPICFGEDVSLRLDVVSSGAWSLTLSDNSVASGVASRTDFTPLKPNSNTTYSISALSDANCNSILADLSGTVAITVNALPVINSLMDTTKVCGTKTILDAGAGYSSYSWSNGSTSRYISTDVSQNYFVTVKNASSCSSIDSTYLSIVDAKLFNNDTTILTGATVSLNAHGILNGTQKTTVYDFSNANALNDFTTLTTNSGTITLTNNGQPDKGVEVIRANNCCSDAEMKTLREDFGYGTYEVDAYSASGIADQSFGIMEQSGSWMNRVLLIGSRPNGTDNQGWDVYFKGIKIALSNTSPVSNSTWYKIKVYITSTTLKVWLNTTVIFDGPLPSAITNPRGAIRVGAYDVSRYDNIKYTPYQDLTYTWSNSSTDQNTTVTPTATATYQLKVTDKTTTCNTSVDIRVLKINILNSDASICNNTSQILSIDSSFSKYATWQTKKSGIEFYNIKKDLNGNLYALPSLNNQKIYKSIDRGETWEQMTGFPNLGGFNFMALGVDQNNVIYASTNNNGIYKSIDEGITWKQLQDFGGGCGPMDMLFGNNYSILTVKGFNRGIWASTGDLVSWQKKVGGFDPNTVTQDINGNLYAGGNSLVGKELYKSSNLGATWSKISNLYGVQIIRADSNGKVFLIEGGASAGLYVSDNQGVSFSQINTLSLPNSGISYPEDILFTKNNMFISKGQIYYSKDNGVNFTQLDKISFPTAGIFNYGPGGAPNGNYGDSSNRMEMIGNRLFVATLDGIKFIDTDNLNTTVTWSTGEVGNKIIVNPIATSPGTTTSYSATVSYGSITGSDQVTFTLPTKPTISASGPTTFCAGGSVTLTANSSPSGVYSYTWQTGAITQGINAASSGSYTVTAVNSNGCSETSIPTIITVNPLPSISIVETDASGTTVNDNIICVGGSATLTASGGVSYLWNTSETVASITKTPVTTTSYTVTGTNANGCENTATQVITVNALPAAPVANSATLNYNGLLQTTPDLIPPSGQSISWFTASVGGVNSSKPQGINVGTYNSYANATIDATGCSSSTRTLVFLTITQKPITITADAGQTKVYGTANPATYTYAVSPSLTGLAALNGSLTRVAGETVGTYAIQQNDLTTANNPNYTITYVGDNFTITQKPITITADAGQTKVYGTANPATYTYAVSPSLTGLAALNGSLTRVAGETVGTYAIQQNDLTTANNPNYTITYVGDNFTITTAPLSITGITGANKIYDGTTIATITGTPSYIGLVAADAGLAVTGAPSFNFNNKNVGTAKPITVTGYTAPSSNYTLTQPTGLTGSITPKTVNVIATANDKQYDGNTTATLSNITSPGLISGDLVTINYASATFDTKEVGNNKTVTVIGINLTSTDAPNYLLASSTATALANITAPPVFIFEVPNAFTPNGDGLNDLLKIISNAGIIELRSFKIFSRSGSLVFESKDLSRGWDGRFNGNLLQVDIYYWTAVYVDRNNIVNSKNGTVLLLK